jgi:hypothetical protein
VLSVWASPSLRGTLMDSALGATPHQPSADSATGRATVYRETSEVGVVRVGTCQRLSRHSGRSPRFSIVILGTRPTHEVLYSIRQSPIRTWASRRVLNCSMASSSSRMRPP